MRGTNRTPFQLGQFSPTQQDTTTGEDTRHADRVTRKTTLAATAPCQALPDRTLPSSRTGGPASTTDPLLGADQGPAQVGVQEQTLTDNRVTTAKIHPQRQTKALETLCGYMEINTTATAGPSWKERWTRSPCLREPVQGTPAEPRQEPLRAAVRAPAATAPSSAAPGRWPRRAGCFWAPAAQSSNPPDGAAAASSCGSSRD